MNASRPHAHTLTRARFLPPLPLLMPLLMLTICAIDCCRFLFPSVPSVQIRTSFGQTPEQWCASVIGSTRYFGAGTSGLGRLAQLGVAELPKECSVLVSVAIQYPDDPALVDYPRHGRNIDPDEAAVWLLYTTVNKMVRNDMDRLDKEVGYISWIWRSALIVVRAAIVLRRRRRGSVLRLSRIGRIARRQTAGRAPSLCASERQGTSPQCSWIPPLLRTTSICRTTTSSTSSRHRVTRPTLCP